MSQNGEDHLLLAAFDGQRRGVYVDVGAFDGVHLSNTWVLEQVGWTGYCIEPEPKVFAQLSRNRPHSICIQAAAGAEEGEAVLFIDPTRLLSSLTDEQDVVARYDAAASYRDLGDEQFERVVVPVTTLDGLLRKHAPPLRLDLVSIDVEGYELEVLSGFDLELHRPRVVVVEANDDDARASLLDRMVGAGYTHARTLSNNLFFAIENEVISRLRWTPVRCFLPRNLHPRGEVYTHPLQRIDRVVVGGRSVPLDDVADGREDAAP